MAKLKDRAALVEFRKKLQSKNQKRKKKLISLCAGSGCGAYGTAKVHQTLVDELKKQKLDKQVEVKLSGCHGFCEKGPIMVIHPEGIFYPQVKEKHVPEIVEETIKKGELVKSLIIKIPLPRKKLRLKKIFRFINFSRALFSATTV